jgi:hypothetical protein
MRSTSSDCFGESGASMAAVRVDMGSTCPFFKGEKQVRGVDQDHDNEASHEDREHNSDGSRQTQPAKQ